MRRSESRFAFAKSVELNSKRREVMLDSAHLDVACRIIAVSSPRQQEELENQIDEERAQEDERLEPTYKPLGPAKTW